MELDYERLILDLILAQEFQFLDLGYARGQSVLIQRKPGGHRRTSFPNVARSVGATSIIACPWRFGNVDPRSVVLRSGWPMLDALL